MRKLSVTGAMVTMLALQASPAMAAEADPAGAGMSVIETLAVFVGVPLAIWGLIWLLWSLPKWRSADRPATGEHWNPRPAK